LVLEDISAIKDFAIKIGFLFRDAWWLDEHSDAALKGYLAKETAVKAGTGGGKASSTARAKRIDAFLLVHARMMSRNPILIDDSPEELAIRAMKIAKKADPGLFEKTSSKTAIEYWEYIRSDADLWKRYQEEMKYFKYLIEYRLSNIRYIASRLGAWMRCSWARSFMIIECHQIKPSDT
jgi:hypothetical protein